MELLTALFVFVVFIAKAFNLPLATITASSSKFVTAALCPNPLDVVVVIDSSGSVQKEWNDIIDHAQYFISTFNISEQHTRIGVIDFSAVANVYKTLDAHNTEEEVYSALENLRARPQNGETWLDLALQRTVELFGSATPQRENVRKIMVLFTDGKMTNKDEESLKSLIKNHRLVSVEGYIVQVNNDSYESTLHEIASSKLHIFKLSGEPVESGKFFLNDAVCFNIDDENDCTTPAPRKPGCSKTTKTPCATTTTTAPISQGVDCSHITTTASTTTTTETPSTTPKIFEQNDCTTPTPSNLGCGKTTPPPCTTPAANGISCGVATTPYAYPIGPSSTVTIQSKCQLENLHASWLVESKIPTTVPVFIPECNSDGRYKKIQHHEGTGYYWCVNPDTGDIIEGTTKDEGNSSEIPNCEVIEPKQSSNLTACLKDKASKLKLSEKIADLNIPECSPVDGLYEPMQIGKGGRFKWCVNRETGILIEGTITDGVDKRPYCTEREGYSICRSKRMEALEKQKRIPDSPVNTCDPNDGQFDQIQYDVMRSASWCVNRFNGEVIKSTLTPIFKGLAKCPELTKCEKEQIAQATLIFQKSVYLFVPQCQKDGLYEELHDDATLPEVWCVNKYTGEKIPETVKMRSQGKPTCPGNTVQVKCLLQKEVGPCRGAVSAFFFNTYTLKCEPFIYGGCNGNENNFQTLFECEKTCGSLSKCLVERETAKLKKYLYAPECTYDGLYKQVQKYEESYWCVDIEKGILIKGTMLQGKVPICDQAISVGEDTFPPNCLKEIVSKRFLPGAFIPQCDKNGHYKEIQVHGSTGNSWCVHKYEGTEIEGTRVSPGQGDPKCPYASNPDCLLPHNSGDCFALFVRFYYDWQKGSCVRFNYGGCGGNKNNFRSLEECQLMCNASQVKPIYSQPEELHPEPEPKLPSETNLPSAYPIPEPEIIPTEKIPSGTPCSVAADFAKQIANSNKLLIGSYIPQCDENGNYQLLQSHASTGIRWCVDGKTGIEINGTRVYPGQKTPICLTNFSVSTTTPSPVVVIIPALTPPPTPNPTPVLTCAERASSNKQIIGAYVPQCDANGNYKVLQIHGSTGFRWCVDPLSGNELPGTRVGPTSKDPICDGAATKENNSVTTTSPVDVIIPVLTPPPTPKQASGIFSGPCSVAANLALQNSYNRLGSFIPDCDENGNYKPLQTHGSTGSSWCVDVKTGIEINGTRVGHGGKAPVCIEDKKICNFTIGKNLVKLGCYRDGQEVPRPLPVLLFDDEGSAEHKGNWVAYTNAIVCKCATETEKRGWYTFGIQNYGACYSGPDEGRYNEDGQAKAEMCIGEDFQKCSTDNNQACVGITNPDPKTNRTSVANYIFMIKTDSHQSIRIIEYDKKKRSISKKAATLKRTKKHF